MAFRRKKRDEVRIEITPMVDVVFLLLIFFMISTSFVDSSAIGINLPQASSGTPEGEQTEVKVYLEEDGTILFNERKVDMEQLKNLMKNYTGNAAETSFKLLADKEVRHGRVIAVVDLARENGFGTLAIATRNAAPAPTPTTREKE
ncbi:MAG: biopolymer transporter ExbD [Geobacteraceae bacterium]|nr:biopolymer transporter ExbD [Geobacteraceae bacterium]